MKKCIKCGENKKDSELDYTGKCETCKRKERDDNDSYNFMRNVSTGDIFNTGLPGGIDLDMSTPW